MRLSGPHVSGEPRLVVCQTFWKPQGWLGELVLLGRWRPAICKVTTPQRVPSLDPST